MSYIYEGQGAGWTGSQPVIQCSSCRKMRTAVSDANKLVESQRKTVNTQAEQITGLKNEIERQAKAWHDKYNQAAVDHSKELAEADHKLRLTQEKLAAAQAALEAERAKPRGEIHNHYHYETAKAQPSYPQYYPWYVYSSQDSKANASTMSQIFGTNNKAE